MGYESIKLEEVIKEPTLEEVVTTAISSFSCRDDDLTHYLQNTCFTHERAGKAKTTLICEKAPAGLLIHAYYSIALHVLYLPPTQAELSNRDRKDIVGFSHKRRDGSLICEVPCYLVGQLAKNVSAPPDINLASILEEVYKTIAQAHSIVGGRVMALDCKEALVPRYEEQDFTRLGNADSEGLYHMFRKII